MKDNIHVFGDLFKEETLVLLHDKTLPKSIVLESKSPFPGYFSDLPNQDLPLYLYLVLDKIYSLVEIERAIKFIKEHHSNDFQGAKTNIRYGGENHVAIRIRHFKGYHEILPLQEAFENCGLKMSRTSFRHKEVDANIELVKFYCLERLEDGIYSDCSEPHHAYIEIPKSLSWDEFEEVTKKVKYNWEELPFDAALGAFRLDHTFVEMVRIYAKDVPIEYLRKARDLYFRKLKV